MRVKETEGSLWRYFSRGTAAVLLLWLLTLAACSGSTNPTTVCNTTPTSVVSPVAGSVTTPSPDNNTVYTLHTPYTTRFWRAATIVIAVVATPGSTLPVDKRVIGPVINGIQPVVSASLTQDQSIKQVSITLPEDTTEPSKTVTEPPGFISLGSTAAVFLSIRGTLQDNTTPLIGDINLEKAVNAINQSNIIGKTFSIDKNLSTIIRAASPDWLTGGGGGGFTGGHPDGSPSSACGKAPMATTCNSGSGSTVYVLDTAYPLGGGSRPQPHITTPAPVALNTISIPASLRPTAPSTSPGCDTFLDVADTTQEMDVQLADLDELGLKILNPNNVNPLEFQEHGLFISALIHHIAPQANIRLIRVLNDWGVGDLQALFYGFYQILKEDVTGAIVNMSLGLVPPPQCLKNVWEDDLPTWEKMYGGNQKRTLTQLNAPGACTGNLATTVTLDPKTRLLYVPLGLMIDTLATRGDHLVAAAGNDTTSFGAELPAALCNVTAVGATGSPVGKSWLYPPPTGNPLAGFSNIPYFDGTNCLSIAPFTGSAQEVPVTTNPPVVAVGATICSLLLHGTSDRLATPAGLATWQGTSFSTAIISGNLALHGGTLPGTLDESQPCR